MATPTIPSARADGARYFDAQMRLDAAVNGIFKDWLNQRDDVRCTPATRVAQLRGIDLAIYPVGRKATKARFTSGIDMKGDNYRSGNIALELVSQCRPNGTRPAPAPGWTAKDMPWVGYYFIQTGESLVLDMAQVWPWVKARIEEIIHGAPSQRAWPFWIAATPNKTYQSFNLMASLEQLLAACPGVYYLNMAKEASTETLTRHSSAYWESGALAAPMLSNVSPERVMRADDFVSRVTARPDYHRKEWLTPHEVERLIRQCEQHARYSRQPGVAEKGKVLTASRPRLMLPEDKLAA